MKAEQLNTYIKDNSALSTPALEEIKKLTEQFPYFQTAHLLYSIASKRIDASLFQQSIKKTAIIAASRTHLYNLLYTEKPKLEVAEVKEEVKPIVKVAEEIKVQEKEQEQTVESENKTDEVKPVEIAVKTENKEELQEQELTEQVEKELEKSVLNAYLEKEVLKTPDLHKKKEEAESPKDASFTQWLSYLKKNNGETYEQIERKVFESKQNEQQKENRAEEDTQQEPLKNKKEQQKQLIDKIIELNPGSIKMNPSKETKFFAADQKAKESLLENEHLVTETLAKIYALQGNISKAIRAYEILSLKFPNKSVYFASLIENLKKGN